MIDITSPN